MANRRRQVRVSERFGPITIWYYRDKTGFRATCRCGWRDGSPTLGDFVWSVKDRASAHIATVHPT